MPVFCFNKITNQKYSDIVHPNFSGFCLNEWIDESQMSDEEKINHKEFYVRGGYLKTFSYQEAWKNFWEKTSEENKEKFLNLPNFCPKIFKEITGIDLEKESEVIELTIEDIAKLKGVDPKQIKIIKGNQ